MRGLQRFLYLCGKVEVRIGFRFGLGRELYLVLECQKSKIAICVGVCSFCFFVGFLQPFYFVSILKPGVEKNPHSSIEFH